MARGARVRGGHDDGGGLLHLHPQGPPKEPPGEGPLTPSRPASPHPPPALVDAADEGTPRAVGANPTIERSKSAGGRRSLGTKERERGRGIGEAAPDLIVNLYSLRLPRGARSTSSSVSFRSQRTRQAASWGRRNTSRKVSKPMSAGATSARPALIGCGGTEARHKSVPSRSRSRSTSNVSRRVPRVAGDRTRGPNRRKERGSAFSLAASSEVQQTTSSTQDVFDPVASNLGQWTGVLCDLNRDGSPRELPPMYVPEAFREWGETLYEWNTYCVTRAIESGSGGLEHTTMRQVPLTACESVQAQHELESKVSSENACLALGESGCAAMAAAAFTREGRTRDASVSASFLDGPDRRIRAEVSVRLYDGEADVALQSGKVYLERRTDLEMGADELDVDGGVRQTSEVASTERGEVPDGERGTGTGFPLGVWATIQPAQDGGVVVSIGRGFEACRALYDSDLALAEVAAS